MTTTTVETKINRKITVTPWGGGNMDLLVTETETDTDTSVFSVLNPGEAKKIGLALLGENATVITDLPEAELKHTWVQAGDIGHSVYSDPEEVLDHAKELLAIHKFLVEKKARDEEEAATKAAAAAAEAEKVKEAARNKRRDELAAELSGARGGYDTRTYTFKAAIDRIIELEEAAKVS